MTDDKRADTPRADTRPQRGGEAATTRFGMEKGGTTETPATGGPESWAEEDERDSRTDAD